MRSGNIIVNFIIYYFILTLLSMPFGYGFLYFDEKYALLEIGIIKSITIAVVLIWFVMLILTTYLSARLSSYHDEGIEDAILGALKEIYIWIKLAIPFLDRNKN